MRATVCDLFSGDHKRAQRFAIFSQEIANARDGLQSSARRSQMHAMVCNLLPGDRKCARWFAIFSQEIANARDGWRSSPGDQNPFRSFLRRFCGRIATVN